MTHTPSLSAPQSIASIKNNIPRIALIGCGAIAERYYLPAFARHPAVLKNLILVDCNETRTQQLAHQFNVKSCLADYRQLVHEVDGAIIATPIDTHYPIGIDLLSRGVNVLCEKPLAESWDKARQMVEEGHRSGAILAVDYLQRLIPSFAQVKELLASKTLGEPLSIQYIVGEEFDWPTVSGFYFNSATSSRGVLRDRGAHIFDHICWWLGGKPRVVSAQTDSFGGSEAVANVTFEHNRCVGEVRLSWLSSFPCTFAIECEAGTVRGDVYDYSSLVLEARSGRKQQLRLGFASKADIGYKMVSNFIDVVATGKKPLVSGGDVLDSISFVDDCYASVTRFDMPWYEIPEVSSAA